MTNRKVVYEAIDAERSFQDRKWGTIDLHPHEVGGWLTLMRKLLNDADAAWATQNSDKGALDEIRKVLAVGVACCEQHGITARWLHTETDAAPQSERTRMGHQGMTLTPEQTALVVRTLAERVMGPACRKRPDGLIDVHFNSWNWHIFNPTTSRDDMAEVEARLTDAQKQPYLGKLTEFWSENYNGFYVDYEWFILTASPLVRAVCLCRALGVQI